MVERNSQLRDIYQEQDRFIKAIAEHADDPRQILVCFSDAAGADGVGAWAPGRKVEITGIREANADVASATPTNTTAWDIDIEDGAGAKTHDLVAKASTVDVDADAIHPFVMPVPADRTVEATEQIKIARAVVGAQGETTICIDYKYID